MADITKNEHHPFGDSPPTIEVTGATPATAERQDPIISTEDSRRHQADATVDAAYRSASGLRVLVEPFASEDTVAETEEKLGAWHVGVFGDIYEKLNAYCAAHPSVFNNVINVLDSFDLKSLDSTFAEVAKVLVEGADLLGELHPFVRVVVSPLKLILSFDLTRRQNNKRVTAVKMQILDTATVLFRLRGVREAEVKGPDGKPLQDIFDLVNRIANDIKECASACDLYLNKNAWSKFLKSNDYEEIFADFINKFNDHKTALAIVLATHTAIAIDAQGAKLDVQSQQLKTIAEKITALFRLLDTTRERDVQRFIDTKGGAQACIKSDVTLKELAEKCGESLESLVPPRSEKTDATTTKKLLEDARKVLNKELMEDVNQAFIKHIDDFVRKLEAQENQLKAQITSAEKHIIAAYEGGPHVNVEDAELRKLWAQQKWKRSVDARDFVLALNEYFASELAHHHSGPPMEHALNLDADGPASPVSVGDYHESEEHGDQWAIAYINLAHLQPLLDVIDTDGSGFINIDEANYFTRPGIRPAGWRLHHWFAFWAAGWHLTVTWYRYRIYEMLRTMLAVVRRVKLTNIQAADSYLAGRGMQCVELLLRATRSPESGYIHQDDTQLRILAGEFHKLEEANLKRQLEQLRYKLDNIDTIQLVTGAWQSHGLRRIEVHIYPLLYLLLQRHLAIMQLACVHNLHEDEFPTMSTSLATIFAAVDYRTNKIKANFMSNARDAQEAFTFFAFGMFEQLHPGGMRERDPIDNTILNQRDEEEDGLKDDKCLGPDPDDDEATAMAFFARIDPAVLLNNIADDPRRLHTPETLLYPATLTEVDALDGMWKGQIIFPDKTQPYGTLSMQLTRTADNKLTGVADSFMGLLSVTGKVESNNLVQFILTWPSRFRYSVECKGKYTAWADTITGLWAPKTENNSPTNARTDLRFVFRRPPGFRLTDEQKRIKVGLEVLTAATINIIGPTALRKARARERWMWLADRLVERRRFINLAKQEIADFQNLSASWKPLNEADTKELQRLKIVLRPCDARVYRELAEFELQQIVDHDRICDSCAKYIRGTRRFCIQCMDNKYNNGIDLCSDCPEATPSSIQGLGFIHKRSHLLVKTIRRIHDGDLDWVIWKAKFTAEQFTERSIAAQAPPSRMEGLPQPDSDAATSQSEDQQQQFRCCYCEKPLSRPFWACLECDADTYICMDCDAKGSRLADCGTFCKDSVRRSGPQPGSGPQSESGPHPVSSPQPGSNPQDVWLDPKHEPGSCPYAARLNSDHKLLHPLVRLVEDNEPPQVVNVTLEHVMVKLSEMEKEIAAVKEKLDGRKEGRLITGGWRMG